MNNQRTEQIRQRAFELWERAHCPEGHHLEHWLCAEVEIAAEFEAECESTPASANPQEDEELSAVAEVERSVARQEPSGAT